VGYFDVAMTSKETVIRFNLEQTAASEVNA